MVAALAANAGVAVAKFAAFGVTGSSSMLAEAVHSVADTGNQALLLLGARRARQAPTERHPFGFARERFFWAFVVALVLFVLGAVFAVYEGVGKLTHPHPIEAPAVALAVLGVALVLETLSMRTAVRAARPLRGTRPWMTFIRETKNAELAVVLLEDLGALVGLVIALAGVGLTIATGDTHFDGAASIAIGGLLGVIAVVLMVEMKALLMGEAVAPDDLAAIRRALAASPRVARILDLRTQHLGPDDLLVAAKVELVAELVFDQVAIVLDEVERRIREAVPQRALVYLEPDRRA